MQGIMLLNIVIDDYFSMVYEAKYKATKGRKLI